MKRLLFWWDAAAFGGHDVSALAALEKLARAPDFQVGILHTGRNPRLAEALVDLARRADRLEIIRAEPPSARSESLDGLAGGPRTRFLGVAMGRWRPDFAVGVQGFITLGLCALGACRDRRIPVLSFLPMTHRIRELSNGPLAWLQDGINRHWYSIPTAFIVTSGRMKDRLVRQQGVDPGRVDVVEYGPVWPVPPGKDRTAARAQWGWGSECVVGVLGRVEFLQKRQDFLIRAVARRRSELEGVRFAVVGDGPDLAAARLMAARLGVGDRLDFLPWQSDMAGLYAALDAVLIPSRFEGVPLVMLEAMARRIPVLASAVDGMADVLPEECLFPSGDAAAMAARLRALPGSPGPATRERLERLVADRFNAASFAEGFASAIQRRAAGTAR